MVQGGQGWKQGYKLALLAVIQVRDAGSSGGGDEK